SVLYPLSLHDALPISLRSGTIADYVHTVPVKAGDAMFLPSGRFHAVGAGNVLVEIQQNSDTTYRVFDWNRVDDTGQPRSLHIARSEEHTSELQSPYDL